MHRVWDKFSDLAHYPLAWLSGLGLFIAEAYAGGKMIVYLVIVAAVIDLFCGVAVSIKKGQYTRSELIKSTVEKLLVYGLVMIVFLCVDLLVEKETGFTTDIGAGLVGVIITLTEAVSFTASLLIIFPKNFFLRSFQRVLKGELARKLNCDESEVDKIMAQARKAKPKRDPQGRFVKK